MVQNIGLSIHENANDPEGALLIRSLVAFNNSVAQPGNWKDFLVSAKDTGGNLIGGIKGHSHWDWLFISHLWVSDDQKGQGLGSLLMERAESLGKERGCQNAWLDTYSFQALPFYKKIGYEEFACLEDYPPGGSRHFLRKKLT
jgi:GNAT superfamily N-acetyltransferase